MDYLHKSLAANEEVIFRTRRHWFVIFGAMFKEILILIVLTTAAVVLSTFAPPSLPLILTGFGVVAIIVLISMLIDFLRWKNQEFIVTNRRVIHSSGIMSKTILDSSLTKINDVILQQSWFGRIFNYGTIKILTASDEVINLLDRIRSPIALKKAMMDAKATLEPASASVSAAPQTATQLLEELDKLRERKMITEAEYEEKRKDIIKRM